MPHKTALSFSGVWKVLALLLLACPFFELAAGLTLALYAASGQGTQCIVFMVACSLFWTCGAWFGGNIALTKRNVRLAAFWGCLLMLPFTWSYWAFIHRPTDAALGGLPAKPVMGTGATADADYTKAQDAYNSAIAADPTWQWVTLAGLNDYYWQAVATGCVGAFGMGMLSTAALAYVAMQYQCAEKSYVGKVLGVYSFGCVIGQGVIMVLKYTYLNSSNSPVLGGILPVVAALGWHYASPVEKEGQKRFHEVHSFWDQLQRFLNMLAPLSCCMAFAQFGVSQIATAKQIDISQINSCVSLSAAVAGAIFFGWGFDAVRKRALQVWNFMAILTLVMCLCTTMGALSNLVVLVSVLCTVVSAGGYVFYMAHMVYESDCCVLSTAAAFNVLSGLAMLLTTLFMAFFDDSMYLCWAYLLITTGLSLALNVNGLPNRRDMRME